MRSIASKDMVYKRFMQKDMNDLQELAIKAISVARDEIVQIFSENFSKSDIVDDTLDRMLRYMSARSQAISLLISSNYVWDAEIILRSFYETVAKIWYICCEPSQNRTDLVVEFWTVLAAANNHKRAHKAGFTANIFDKSDSKIDSEIMNALTDRELFDFGSSNKAERRKIADKWSFSAIIERLAKSGAAGMDWSPAKGMLFMYGQQSHLIHADDAALDLMLDRKVRPEIELRALHKAHVARLFSDQVSLWFLTSVTLRFRFSLSIIASEDLLRVYSEFNELSQFMTSDFYDILEQKE